MKIVVAEQHTTSYLYLLGASFDRELVLNDYLTLLPAKCSPLPDDMIDSVMKYGSQDETDLGILIATLRKTTAQLRVVGAVRGNLHHGFGMHKLQLFCCRHF